LTGKEVPFYREWIKHNTLDEYYEPFTFHEKLKELDIPVFLQSGWFDGDGIGTKLNYYALAQSKSPLVKVVIGPWGHSASSSTRYMDLKFGDEAGLDLQRLYLRWFDHWLKGFDNGITSEPEVMLFDMFSNRWHTGDSFPLPQSVYKQLYLDGEGDADDKSEGLLTFEAPMENEDYDEYIYNPEDPTPTWDQRIKDEKDFFDETVNRPDILVYETAPMTEPMTLAGPVELILYAESDAPDTDWFGILYAVRNDSDLVYLSKGCIRARYRNSFKETKLLEPGKIELYGIDMWQTGLTLKEGDKLRLEIQSAYFPNFSRNLNTGGNNEMETEYRSAHQKIHHSKEYPSHLLIPVIPE
jgi:putative CocE/NonD family hydrolase